MVKKIFFILIICMSLFGQSTTLKLSETPEVTEVSGNVILPVQEDSLTQWVWRHVKLDTLVFFSAEILPTAIRSPTKPTFKIVNGRVLPLIEGDQWLDTDDGNKPYTYDGTQWIQDYTSIHGGHIVTGSLSLQSLDFTPIVSSGGTGDIVATINASSEGIRISGDKIQIDGNVSFSAGYDPTVFRANMRQATAPATRPDGTSLKEGDQWIDSDAGDRVYTWTGSSWQKAITQIDGGEITTGFISAQRIASESITADKIDVDDLFAQNITATGTITGGTFTGGTFQTSANGERIVLDADNKIKIYDETGYEMSIGGTGGFITSVNPFYIQSIIRGASYIQADAGFRQGTMTAGRYLRSNGTNFVSNTIQASDIPSLDASKTTSGEFDIDRIPEIPLSKIEANAARANRVAVYSGTGALGYTTALSDYNKLVYLNDVTSNIQAQLDALDSRISALE